MNTDQKRASRAAVRDAAQGHCEYCGTFCWSKGTLDHWMPRVLGGGNDRANMRWACVACNQAKSGMHPDEWEKVKPPYRRPVLTRAEKRMEAYQLIFKRVAQQRAQA